MTDKFFEEIKALEEWPPKEQVKEVKAEAKARGYDVKVLTKIIAERKRSADDLSEEEAVAQMYREALGMR